jgi:hypothetical protein
MYGCMCVCMYVYRELTFVRTHVYFIDMSVYAHTCTCIRGGTSAVFH